MNMDDAIGKSSLEQIVERLSAHGVEFIVIGGKAEALYGSDRPTYDTDLCYRRTRTNLERLALALLEFKPTLRGAPPDLPFRIDATSLALGCNFTFSTSLGDLDLLGEVEPIGLFEQVMQNAVQLKVGEADTWIIGLDDLIKIKEHIGRPKDRLSLMYLLAIKKLRDETGQK